MFPYFLFPHFIFPSVLLPLPSLIYLSVISFSFISIHLPFFILSPYSLNISITHFTSLSLLFIFSLYLSYCILTPSFPYLLISDFFLLYFHLFTFIYSVPLFTKYSYHSFYVAVLIIYFFTLSFLLYSYLFLPLFTCV